MSPETRDARQVLDDLVSRGIEIEGRADTVNLKPTSAVTPALVEAIRRIKPALLDLLGPVCDRCDQRGFERVLAYWGPSFCPPCARATAEELDAADAWPPVPWGECGDPRDRQYQPPAWEQGPESRNHERRQ